MYALSFCYTTEPKPNTHTHTLTKNYQIKFLMQFKTNEFRLKSLESKVPKSDLIDSMAPFYGTHFFKNCLIFRLPFFFFLDLFEYFNTFKLKFANMVQPKKNYFFFHFYLNDRDFKLIKTYLSSKKLGRNSRLHR